MNHGSRCAGLVFAGDCSKIDDFWWAGGARTLGLSDESHASHCQLRTGLGFWDLMPAYLISFCPPTGRQPIQTPLNRVVSDALINFSSQDINAL